VTLRVDPALQLAQLGRGRHLAGGQHLAFGKQRGAGGVQRLQQRARVAEQRQPPVAFGRRGLDQALFEPAHQHRHLGMGIVLDGGDARGHHLGQQVAGGAHGVAQVARAVVVAAIRPHSRPSRTSDTTTVAVTPMFFRYCRCSGDMLRR
jgi:hypothetical protein